MGLEWDWAAISDLPKEDLYHFRFFHGGGRKK